VTGVSPPQRWCSVAVAFSILRQIRCFACAMPNLPDEQIRVRRRFGLSSPNCKNIFLLACPKSNLEPAPSRPIEGRLAIVTDAGRDAMDAEVLLTNGTEADGEVVWS